MKKQQLLCLLLTLLFAGFAAGYFIGSARPAHVSITLPTPSPSPAASPTAASSPSVTDTAGRIDLNRATAEELSALPGIGEVLAGAIVAHREKHGPFAQPSDIMQVPGIGDKKYAAVQDHIYTSANGK